MDAKPFVSESLLFAQTLEALNGIEQGAGARRELKSALERFVLSLPARDARKAERFEALLACPHFDANFPIETSALASPSLSGLPEHTLRPFEFAITQFIVSEGSPSWRSAAMRMAASEAFSAALLRPLLFTRVELAEAPGCPEPIVRHRHIPAFAHNFLAREAERMEPAAAERLLSLAKALQMRMDGPSRVKAGQEKFLLAAFGDIVACRAAQILALAEARAPIAKRGPQA